MFAERRGPLVKIRDETGRWRDVWTSLAPVDSMMTHAADPRDALELLTLRERMRSGASMTIFAPTATRRVGAHRWAPTRRFLPATAPTSPQALQTIREVGGSGDLDDTIADAFPGSTIAVAVQDGYFEVELRQHGLLRPLKTSELSDGTLRYLLLAAALLSPGHRN